MHGRKRAAQSGRSDRKRSTHPSVQEKQSVLKWRSHRQSSSTEETPRRDSRTVANPLPHAASYPVYYGGHHEDACCWCFFADNGDVGDDVCPDEFRSGTLWDRRRETTWRY